MFVCRCVCIGLTVKRAVELCAKLSCLEHASLVVILYAF